MKNLTEYQKIALGCVKELIRDEVLSIPDVLRILADIADEKVNRYSDNGVISQDYDRAKENLLKLTDYKEGNSMVNLFCHKSKW